MGRFRDSQAPSLLPGARTDVPTEPPSHRPCQYNKYMFNFIHIHISVSGCVDHL